MKKISILLLVTLMLFAAVSCKSDTPVPAEQNDIPTPHLGGEEEDNRTLIFKLDSTTKDSIRTHLIGPTGVVVENYSISISERGQNFRIPFTGSRQLLELGDE